MKKPNRSNLRAGRTLYHVLALDGGSFMQALSLTGKEFVSHGRAFINHSGFLGEMYGVSLSDTNIIPNTYNRHRVFYSKKKARSYLGRCLSGEVKRMKHATGLN